MQSIGTDHPWCLVYGQPSCGRLSSPEGQKVQMCSGQGSCALQRGLISPLAHLKSLHIADALMPPSGRKIQMRGLASRSAVTVSGSLLPATASLFHNNAVVMLHHLPVNVSVVPELHPRVPLGERQRVGRAPGIFLGHF